MSKKDIHYLEYLIEKEEKGTLSEAERKLLNDFFNEAYDQAAWNAEQMGAKERVSGELYAKIKKRAGLGKSRSSYAKYAIAAVITVVVGASLWLKPQMPVKEITVATKSSIDSVKLSDGSTVYLAAHTSFKYPEHFGTETRSVSLLKGNAFFKVAKDRTHPFVIASGAITTKVLGTSFHIGLDKNKTSVSVVTGHVKVSTKAQAAYLLPNESAVFTTEGGLQKEKTGSAFMYNWFEKDISLNDVTLSKVLTILNFNYGICFKADDPKILDTRITLYLNTGLPLNDIINQLKYITHLKFAANGENKITVSQ